MRFKKTRTIKIVSVFLIALFNFSTIQLLAIHPCLASASKSEYEKFLFLCEDDKFHQALPIINSLIAKKPGDSDYLAGRARILIEQKKFKRALADCNKAIKSNPKNFSAYRRRAYCHLVSKNYRAGIKDLSFCIRNGGGIYYDRMFECKDYLNRMKACQLIGGSKIDRRNTVYERELDRALQQRASSQLKNGIKILDNLIKTKPNFMLAYPVRGLIELNFSWNKKAVGDFSKYLTKFPDSAPILFYRADAYRELKKHDKAIADYSRILALNPKLASFAYTANTGRTRESFQYKDYHVNNMADIHFLRGSCYVNTNQYKSALQDFSKVVQLDPKEWEAFYERGKIRFHLKQYKLAVQDFTKAIKLKPRFHKSYIERARVYEKLKNSKAAVYDLTSVISSNPKDPGAYLLRGQLYERSKQNQKALADYSQMIKLAPKDDDGYRYRGDLNFKLGRFQQAIKDYKAALSLNSEDKATIIKSIEKAKQKLK